MQRFIPELIGEKIREERIQRGLLQKDLAEMMYLNVSAINRMEKHGESTGNMDRLVLVANTLNVDVRVLVDAGIDDK